MPDAKNFKIEALFPNFYHESWVAYTLKSVLEGLEDGEIDVGATVLAKAAQVTAANVHPVMSRRVHRLVRPYITRPMEWTFRSARKRLNGGDVAYFWLGSPAIMCNHFRSRGIMVVREMINCTLELRRRELTKAYAALGEPDRSGISDEMILDERRDLLGVDAIFCPSPFVRQSVLDYGVPPERCIDTSYGWNAERLATGGRVSPDDGVFTVAFVGTIDVRKGVPLLLEAWLRSGVKGRLLLAGHVSPDIEHRFGDILSRPDVIRLGYVHDVGAVYRAADVFCFPSWEEGCPLVTLEAMAMGSIPVVTPMGTGGAFSEVEDIGIVIPPGNVEALGRALSELASDRPRVEHMKQQAKARAAQYTWHAVGQRRRTALIQKRDMWKHARASV